MSQITLGEITADIIQKDIKNLNLRVCGPAGRVRISAPRRMKLDTIRAFTLSKLGWIKKQQLRLKHQKREAPREYVNGESHYFGGERYLLTVEETNQAPHVIFKHNTIKLRVRPWTSTQKKAKILDEWYRTTLKEVLPALIVKWEIAIGVKVREFGIKKMKTRWGTCNSKVGRIWLSLELAKKPAECLEHVLVHEMVHLIENNHGKRFVALMDKHLPKWRLFRDQLNRFPISHTNWKY